MAPSGNNRSLLTCSCDGHIRSGLIRSMEFTKFGLTTPTLSPPLGGSLSSSTGSSIVRDLLLSRTSLDLCCVSPCSSVLPLLGGNSPVNLGPSTDLIMSSGLMPSNTSSHVGFCSPVDDAMFSKKCHTVFNVCCCSLAVVFGEGLWYWLACPLSGYHCWQTFLLVLPDLVGLSTTMGGSSGGDSLGTTVTLAKSDLCRLFVWLVSSSSSVWPCSLFPALTSHSYSMHIPSKLSAMNLYLVIHH